MQKHILILITAALGITMLNGQSHGWVTAGEPWPPSFGSQRAVIQINNPSIAAEANIPWRRHDRDPGERRFLVIEASTGDTIKNIRRLEVDAEHGLIRFGPIAAPGIYYFYYLPFEVQEGWGFYGKDYLKPEPAPDPAWLEADRNNNPEPAGFLRIECRTPFDSFFPMEIIPTGAEKKAFLEIFREPVLFFTESREYPIRMKDEIPRKWIDSRPSSQFAGHARPNEYYAFQVGIFAAGQEVTELTVHAGKLTGPSGNGNQDIVLTCLNTHGVDPYGVPFVKKLNVAQGRVQALWLGADIPENAKPGKYAGSLTISAKNMADKQIRVTLEVQGPVLADRGDSEPWRHSRLRWLNSTAGSDGNPVSPYLPVKKNDDRHFEVAGHAIGLSNNGLPETISHRGSDILSSPVTFEVETQRGPVIFPAVIKGTELLPGKYTRMAAAIAQGLEANYSVRLDYDGYLQTKVILRNRSEDQQSAIRDIRLTVPMASGKAKYMMGMGLPGCAVPASHESKWKGPSDSFWIGDAYGGIWCELRGSTYHGPLLNLYRPAPPESWNNDGRGGFRIRRDKEQVIAEVYSGERTLNPGDSVVFEWAMLITPVKDLNPASQFNERYYHNGAKPAAGKGRF
jgi:hypothetical protein